MSYILDALRRADAERQQGAVPGLAAQVDVLRPPARERQAWLPALLLSALMLLGLGTLAWWWLRAPPAAPAVVASPAATAARPPPAPAIEPPQPSLPIVVSAPTPPPPTPAPAPAPAAAAQPGPGAATPSPPRAAPGAGAPVQDGGPAAARPIPLAQLPEPQRRELPPLAVGGSVWSDNAPSRFVILDGQVLREGDSVAPGLVLERIQRKSVLLRWREMRLEIPL